MAFWIADIQRQFEAGTLVLDDEADAIIADCRREVRSPVLVVLIVDLLAGRKSEQIQQRSNNRVINNRSLIPGPTRRGPFEVTQIIDAAKLWLCQEFKKA